MRPLMLVTGARGLGQFLDADVAPAPETGLHPAVATVNLDRDGPGHHAAFRAVRRLVRVGHLHVVDPDLHVRDVAFDTRADRVPRLALPGLHPRRLAHRLGLAEGNPADDARRVAATAGRTARAGRAR